MSEITNLRGALAWIHNSTEPDAIKHRNYDELAAGIYGIAKAALDGEFVDDMHAAEVYDTLYPSRAALMNALEEIAAMDPKGIRADDLGRAARIASDAIRDAVGSTGDRP